MKHKSIFFLVLLYIIIISCKSDDDGPTPTVTSFSGVVLYEETMEPVTTGEISISGIDTGILRGPRFPAFERLTLEDGTFEVTFETIEEVDRFRISIGILQGSFIINSFVGGGADGGDGLQCLPGNCRDFAPGQDYELTILVPCVPDDCVQFPPP